MLKEELIACNYLVDNELNKLIREAGIDNENLIQQRRFASEIRYKVREYSWFVDFPICLPISQIYIWTICIIIVMDVNL